MSALVFHNSQAKKEMKTLQKKKRLQENEGTERTKTVFFLWAKRGGEMDGAQEVGT